MCGIFGYIGKRTDAAQLVLEGLKKLEYRGYDSWGVAVVTKDKKNSQKIFVKKHIGKIGDSQISNFQFPISNLAFGHTRWATHGGVTQKNAHPHLDCTGKIAIIHNGIIENYSEIKKRLIKLGHKFVSETDSEVAAHLIEEKKNSFLQSVRLSFLEFEGLNAIVAMNSETGELVAVKNGSPLVIGLGKKENFIASDAQALLSHTRKVYFLEDGEMIKIAADKVELFDLKSGEEKEIKIQTLDWQIESAELGKYPHFMLKEIMEQGKIIRNISQNLLSEIGQAAELIKKSYGTYLLGCGSAYYSALFATYLFSRVARHHLNAAAGSEFGYTVDFLTKKSLVIALSQSGETIDIIDSVKKAKEKDAKILAIVNNLGSTLYRMVDFKILLGAGPEKCVLATKSFTAKLAVLILLAYSLDGRLEKGKEILERATKETEEILKKERMRKIKELAKLISREEHIYVVGRGQSYPIALEAALKIKEASYLHAEGFAAGELKHGVIALIEKETPCLVFAPNDETYAAVISGAMEMKARGGYIIGVSFKPNEVFDEFFQVTDCGDATAIPNVIIAQLFGYYLSLAKGNDPDKPRNLAKSVTVK